MEEKETRFDRSTERSECLIAEYKKLRKDEAKMSQKSLEDITGVPRQNDHPLRKRKNYADRSCYESSS